jgi:hypothetical protein
MHKLTKVLSALFLAGATTSAVADNRTFSGSYDGSEPTIPSGPGTCSPTGGLNLAYVIGGTFRVSASGEYTVLEASNIGFTGLGGLADSVVLIYEGSFSAANPGANLVGAFDFDINDLDSEGFVFLDAGTDYVLVMQRWCSGPTGPGSWAALLEGPGSFSGDGFPTPGDTFGDFAGVTDIATFPGYGSTSYRYAVGDTIKPSMTGQSLFLDLAVSQDQSPVAILIYEGSFNPSNTSANLFADLGFGGPVVLESGNSYTPVFVDVFEVASDWLSVAFPPGQTLTGSHMNGSWYNRATNGQGLLMEFGPNTQNGFLFMAWFTFDDGASFPAGDKPQAVGSPEQRWMTGFASGVLNQMEFDVDFANSTGGRFNDPGSPVNTDGSYGTGRMTIVDCDAILLDFDLPDGNSDTLELERILKGEIGRCYEQTPVGPLTP